MNKDTYNNVIVFLVIYGAIMTFMVAFLAGILGSLLR